MNIKQIYTKRLWVPNVIYNEYELVGKTNFWGNETWFIRAKDNYNNYTEEHRVTGDEWRVIEKEIGLINWFYYEGLSKTELEDMKSSEFQKQIKEYIGCKINDIEQLPNTNKLVLVKKRWALELWRWYNNCYRLSGIGQFRLMGGESGGFVCGRDMPPQVYYWEWLEKYGLIH